jgi:hypothetical protein
MLHCQVKTVTFSAAGPSRYSIRSPGSIGLQSLAQITTPVAAAGHLYIA